MGEGLGVRAPLQWTVHRYNSRSEFGRVLPMNLTLTRPAATLSHPMGEGLGVRALFYFMVPTHVKIWRCLLPMNRRVQSIGYRRPTSPRPSPPSEGGEGGRHVHGRNARPKVGGRGFP